VTIYLLDTDTLICMVRGLQTTKHVRDKQRAEKLVERCRSTQAAGDRVGLSAVTVSELEFGARSSGRYETEMEAVRKVLIPIDMYDYDSVSCPHHYGRIRHELESRGSTIGAMDLLIAAHSLALAATLVSKNQAHLSRVSGLTTVNWV
jgi:tRNA(fMet)-specific endonuclease VapC